MTANIKEEIHELIEVTTDEQLLNAVKVILSSHLPISSEGNGKKSRPALKKTVLPNGRIMFVTPGDPTIDASELFGIWKEEPEQLDTLRKTAWGGRA